MTKQDFDLQKRIQDFASLEYKREAYQSRNWGHVFHSLCSYPSKLKPSIAYFLVRTFTNEGEIVLDPFSGVGTIPFEACSQGRIGIGSDINPVAFHVTQAKVNPPLPNEVERQISQLKKYIEANKTKVDAEDAEAEIREFYHPDTLQEILSARDFFLSNEGRNMSFIIACTLHILHGNRPYALSRTSHNIMPWSPKGPFEYKSLIASLTKKALRTLEDPLPLAFVRGKALQDNVTKLNLEGESVNCILTSPPFHSNRDFLRMNRIRLWFCGWSYSKQSEIKPDFFENKKDMKSYGEVFSEFNRVLKKRSLCILHLGVVKKVDMATKIRPLAEKNGFEFFRTIYEDTSTLESHGIVDRGATQKHEFLILGKEYLTGK